MRDLVSEGLDEALWKRTPNPHELFFQGKGNRFELSIEARIPDGLRELTSREDLDVVRYQIAVGLEENLKAFELKGETLLLCKGKVSTPSQRTFFPSTSHAPDTLMASIHGSRNKAVLNKVLGGNDNFYSETYGRSGRGWAPSFKLGAQKSALGNLPADESSFPVATWFRSFLTEGVQELFLNSRRLRFPSPPTRIAGFLPDGSNLPWVVARLLEEDPGRHKAWVKHLRTALPDLEDITTFERPEDRHSYMTYHYAGGMDVPSWLASDGTLRLTGLTLPAYLADFQGTFLIEEPENGIHPSAVSIAFDSLSSMYKSQVLLATHSPVVLNMAQVDHVLCFAKNDVSATDIVPGSEHPRLRDWQGNVDLGTLLASGVLG